MIPLASVVAFSIGVHTDGQGYFVIPQPRPYEPNIFSVCACDFGDNFFLHLVSGLLEHAPNGFSAHATDANLHSWLAGIQCDPWPMEAIDTAVSHAVGGSPFWDDYRFGKRYHYLDMWIREDFEYNPKIGLATRAACLPGRLLLSLVCAHQALLPATSGGEVKWSKFASMLQSIQEVLPMAVGRGTEVDLGGCAASWPWAPVFAGDKCQRLEEYVNRILGGGINPSMPWIAAYSEPFKLSPSEHANINPYLQPCVPMLNCWPFGLRAMLSEKEQCEYCCNPAHGASGDPSCFDSTYSFERCCTPLAGQQAPAEAAIHTAPSIDQASPQVGSQPELSCFDAVYTSELCCSPAFGPSGHPSCFDGVYTFERCCSSQAELQAEQQTGAEVITTKSLTTTILDQAQQLSQKLDETGENKERADKSKHCHAWAMLGECEKNNAYMMKNCNEACNCHDENEHCDSWAGLDRKSVV